MRCEELAERLTDMLEGELDSDEEAAALDHLASCEKCEQVLAETREVTKLAHDHGRVEVDDADRERIFDEIASEVRSPDFE